jgi:hypothetical protein
MRPVEGASWQSVFWFSGRTEKVRLTSRKAPPTHLLSDANAANGTVSKKSAFFKSLLERKPGKILVASPDDRGTSQGVRSGRVVPEQGRAGAGLSTRTADWTDRAESLERSQADIGN